MIHLLIILNLLILPILFWRYFAAAGVLIGMLLWKLRFVFVALVGIFCFLIWRSANTPTLNQDPAYVATHQDHYVTEAQKAQMSDQWLKEQMAKWPMKTDDQGQSMKRLPEATPAWAPGTRYVMENSTHRTGHLLPNGVFVPDPGQ